MRESVIYAFWAWQVFVSKFWTQPPNPFLCFSSRMNGSISRRYTTLFRTVSFENVVIMCFCSWPPKGYGNRPPIDDRIPIRKFSIDCLDASNPNEQTQLQVTRYCRESRRKADMELQYRPRIVDTVRAACLQNETAPEKLLNRYEKRFEKREKGSEKRSETRLKKF